MVDTWIWDGLKWLTSAAAGATIAGHLVKKKIEHHFNRGLAKYNSELSKELAKHNAGLTEEVESLKAELQLKNNKHQITFSKLHADRAVIIKELYSKLVEVELSANELLGPNGIINRSIPRSRAPRETGEIFDNLKVNTIDLLDHYRKNRIYFSEEICKLFEDIIYEIPTIAVQFFPYLPSKGVQVQEETISMQQMEKEDSIVAEYVLDEMPKIKKALEAEFKKLLGVIEG
ncbi:hypothetical protein [Bacillus mycoides]|uniref:hypothetical protein n=1 Tax=Bacillus mycoides TaxID=1405 RepID=UPI002E22E1C6|nr:hypothetical protein [Bacillus mycoides]